MPTKTRTTTKRKTAKAKPSRADSDVRRAAPNILGEARHVLEPATDLLSIKIDRNAADGDQVEGAFAHGLKRPSAARTERRTPSSSDARR